MNKASAVETVDSGSVPDRVKPKKIKNWYSQLQCLALSIEKDSVKTTSCEVYWWTGRGLIQRLENLFTVYWPR